VAAGRPLFGADVDQPVEKCSGGQDQGAAVVSIAILHRQPGHAPVFDDNPPRMADDPGDVRFTFELAGDPRGIPAFVGLRPRRPHRRAATSIEQLELQPRRVDRSSHQPAKRIDLSYEMTLGRPSHRRIARHVRHAVSGQRTEPDVTPEPRGGVRRLDTGVPGTNDDHVKLHFGTLPIFVHSSVFSVLSSCSGSVRCSLFVVRCSPPVLSDETRHEQRVMRLNDELRTEREPEHEPRRRT
jgi:hypothetical protein